MRHARRSSLLALLLTVPAGLVVGPGVVLGQTSAPPAEDAGAAPEAGGAADHEQATRQEVEDSERLHAMQIDAQAAATEQAAAALQEEQRLTAEQADALRRLRAAEAAVNDMTAHMLELNRRRADAQHRIDQETAALRPLLPIIMRMSSWPAETLLATRLSAEDSVRGIIVLRGLARQAEQDAQALIADRKALDAATKAAAVAAPELAAAEAARYYEADTLSRQLADAKARRTAAQQEAADAARRAAAEAARASSLRSMLQILETQRRLEEARAREDELRAQRDQKQAAVEAAQIRQAALGQPTGAGTLAADAKPDGQITPPVSGTLLRAWGDTTDGEPATGQSWRTQPGARVVAPCDGTVAFAEPFRGYGLLVIIDCGGGYHAVLGGLDQIVVAPGKPVHGGDVVGAMAAASDAAPTSLLTGSTASGAAPASNVLSGASAASLPVLYFELRKGGRPVNPAPWLKPLG